MGFETAIRSRPSDRERANLSAVLHHLANVAIDGVSEEVDLTLAPGFGLHIDGTSTDRWGYYALIEANRATYGTRPPLDVEHAFPRGDFVSVRLEPSCLAHFRVIDGLIVELWMTVEWQTWCRWLLSNTLT